MIPAIVGAACAVLGVLVGWWARGRAWTGPTGWALVFPSLREASAAWRSGTTVYRIDQQGARPMTSQEIDQGLGVVLRSPGLTRCGECEGSWPKGAPRMAENHHRHCSRSRSR